MSSVKRTAAFTTFVASLHAAHSRGGQASARVEAYSVWYAVLRFSRVLRFSCPARRPWPSCIHGVRKLSQTDGFVTVTSLGARCGGTQLPSAIPNAATTQISSSAASGALLYAAGTDTSTRLEYVYVLTYPRVKLVFRLGPFAQNSSGGITFALGLCIDNAGNVYIVDPDDKGSGRVYVYKHGARDLSRTLTAFGGSYACSVDPLSGDLAVLTNMESVQIYRKARGNPHTYSPISGTSLAYLTYGAAHKLYLAGQIRLSGLISLEVFTRGHFHRLMSFTRLPGNSALNVHWHAGMLVGTIAPRELLGQDGYVIQVNGYQAHVEQTFALYRKKRESPHNDSDVWIQGDTVVAPGHGLGSLDFWKYPLGGDPERSVHVGGVNGYFTSVVVSPAQ